MALTTVSSRSRLDPEIPRFRARVVFGPDSGAEAEGRDGRLSIGTEEGSTLRLTDPTVSRFHLEVEATPSGLTVRDLGSKNGTLFHDAEVREMVLHESAELDLGRTRVKLMFDRERTRVPATDDSAFGALIGEAPAMRAVYEVLRRAAPTTASVLITGESGTGKELAARALHLASPRAKGPFEIVDCGGLPPTLIESELFGHERGAFTGATHARAGAFERAHGGTIFLDELGELPVDVQPKLLRALGEGEVRRVGGRTTEAVDVRVVAATHRDLRRDINAGRFRADLYFRLAVIQVRMPALRERLEDLPGLGAALLTRIQRDRGYPDRPPPGEDFWRTLAQHDWPGNVRELRNYLEQTLVLDAAPALGEQPVADEKPAPWFEGLESQPMTAAKLTLLERFEREYLARVLAQTNGNVAEAARRAGVDRRTLFRMIRRHSDREE